VPGAARAARLRASGHPEHLKPGEYVLRAVRFSASDLPRALLWPGALGGQPRGQAAAARAQDGKKRKHKLAEAGAEKRPAEAGGEKKKGKKAAAAAPAAPPRALGPALASPAGLQAGGEKKKKKKKLQQGAL
jgi:hypothetical protein